MGRTFNIKGTEGDLKKKQLENIYSNTNKYINSLRDNGTGEKLKGKFEDQEKGEANERRNQLNQQELMLTEQAYLREGARAGFLPDDPLLLTQPQQFPGLTICPTPQQFPRLIIGPTPPQCHKSYHDRLVALEDLTSSGVCEFDNLKNTVGHIQDSMKKFTGGKKRRPTNEFANNNLSTPKKLEPSLNSAVHYDLEDGDENNNGVWQEARGEARVPHFNNSTSAGDDDGNDLSVYEMYKFETDTEEDDDGNEGKGGDEDDRKPAAKDDDDGNNDDRKPDDDDGNDGEGGDGDDTKPAAKSWIGSWF